MTARVAKPSATCTVVAITSSIPIRARIGAFVGRPPRTPRKTTTASTTNAPQRCHSTQSLEMWRERAPSNNCVEIKRASTTLPQRSYRSEQPPVAVRQLLPASVRITASSARKNCPSTPWTTRNTRESEDSPHWETVPSITVVDSTSVTLSPPKIPWTITWTTANADRALSHLLEDEHHR